MMQPRRTIIGTAAALALCSGLIAGCDKEDGRARPGASNASASAPTTAPAATPAAATGKGVIRGKVKYAGPPPVLKPTQRDCHPGVKVNIPDESVVLGPGGEVRNAIVYLKNPPPGGEPHAPPPILDQKDCVYTPHVIAAQTGQTLKFTSSDPVLHNVHVIDNPNGEVNRSIAKGDVLPYPVNTAGFVKAVCDVHPWMSVRIGVFDHPFFAVTGDDGAFEFTNLPPGTYTVAIWHEKLRQTTQDASVADAKPTELTVTLSPRDSK